MPAATPTRATVETALKTALDAISSLGTVYKGFHTREDDVEFLKVNSLISAGSANVFFVILAGITEQEGDAAGEVFEFYQYEVRYWSLRTGNADWSTEALAKAESVRDALSGAAAIFAIGGQRQLLAPETVQILSHGPENIRGGEAGDQMVYMTRLGLTVEARRWS